MKIFVWDTETTGFARKDDPLDKQPHIVQFGGILVDMDPATGEYTEIQRINELVKPPIPIPFGASQVHGIYDKDVVDEVPVGEKMDIFLKVLNDADYSCGHNIEYDEWVLNSELLRLGRKWDYNPNNVVDTMKESVDFCQLPGRGFGYKFPKLNELYKKIHGEWFSGAHDAMVDVEATLKCLAHLVSKGVIKLEQAQVLKLF